MADEFSPEEKLLKLIRGERKQKEKQIPDNPALPVDLVEVKKEKPDYFRFINIGLIIILVVCLAFFLLDFLNSKANNPITKLDSEVMGKRQPETISRETTPEEKLPPVPAYPDAIGTRELFKPQASRSRGADNKVSDSAYDKLKDFTLKGIIAGNNPQAIIEDLKNEKTYFLFKGQRMNQIKVEDIKEDRVILDINGEVLELAL